VTSGEPERTPIGSESPAQELDGGFPAVIDPSEPIIVSAWGRKGAGKSTFNRRLYQSWPYDKLCIDVNGDAKPGLDTTPISAPLPARFPPPETSLPGSNHRGPQNLYYRADPGSPTYSDDLDRAVGLALFPQAQRTLVWVGECGEFMPSAQATGPHMRRLLRQSRHYNVSALFDDPRPAFVNPLVIGQSDLVAIYELPNPDDRERIAKTIGYPQKRFHEEYETTLQRGKYWYLLWVAAAHQLYRCAPLPTD
jgi:hypothetical protein